MCNNPIVIKSSNKLREISSKVPCGNCLGCRLDRLQLWSERCRVEAKNRHNAFVTLTYDNYHLHYVDKSSLLPTLDYHDFQKFLWRLRMFIKRNRPEDDGKYKMFACGEYGGKFLRPHIHVLFFGLDFSKYDSVFKKLWMNGMVKTLPLLPPSIRYVVDYFTKEHVNGELAKARYDSKGLQRPFKCASHGLGSAYFLEHAKEINETGCVKIGARHVPIPPYYKRMLCDWTLKHTQQHVENQIKYRDKLRQEAEKYNLTLNEYEDYIRKVHELSLLSSMRKDGVSIDDRTLNIKGV